MSVLSVDQKKKRCSLDQEVSLEFELVGAKNSVRTRGVDVVSSGAETASESDEDEDDSVRSCLRH
jgi:hypothetical protein